MPPFLAAPADLMASVKFDLDGDGIVSFDEWQQFLVQQKLIEAKKGKAEKEIGRAHV